MEWSQQSKNLQGCQKKITNAQREKHTTKAITNPAT
jgi:hypothetical protein